MTGSAELRIRMLGRFGFSSRQDVPCTEVRSSANLCVNAELRYVLDVHVLGQKTFHLATPTGMSMKYLLEDHQRLSLK